MRIWGRTGYSPAAGPDPLAGFVATPITARRGLLARLYRITRVWPAQLCGGHPWPWTATQHTGNGPIPGGTATIAEEQAVAAGLIRQTFWDDQQIGR